MLALHTSGSGNGQYVEQGQNLNVLQENTDINSDTGWVCFNSYSKSRARLYHWCFECMKYHDERFKTNNEKFVMSRTDELLQRY